jgi:peptidoglycan/LPS O-acetylase OafA/YrhL
VSTTKFSENNLDCLRLILASIVALFHIFALTSLSSFSAFGTYLSPHFAVRGFFVISGMLIYRSYTRSSSVSSYFEKRLRRIYPAYVTVVTLTAITLGALSTLRLSRYFVVGFWKYLVANLLFLNFAAPSLPGVFGTHVNTAVNGALWTLKIEVIFYLSVPLIYYLCRRFGTKAIMAAVFCLSCVWKYGFALLDALERARSLAPLDDTRTIFARMEVQFPAQLAYFSAGILLLIYFDTLKKHFLLISCITGALFLVDHFFTHESLDLFWISGAVFVFGFWRYFGNFSKFGDFSYGVYIVHWPILQVLIALGVAALSPALFLATSIMLIFIAAFTLWHLIEKRFLATSSHYRHSQVETAEPNKSLHSEPPVLRSLSTSER